MSTCTLQQPSDVKLSHDDVHRKTQVRASLRVRDMHLFPGDTKAPRFPELENLHGLLMGF